MSASLTDTVCRADVLSAELDRDCILVDIDAGKYLQLNPVAAEIWKGIATPVAVKDLCQRLYARFDAPPEIIDAGVLGFLEKLAARGMIRNPAA